MGSRFRARIALALLAAAPAACATPSATSGSAAVTTAPAQRSPAPAAPAAAPARRFVSPYSYEWFIRAELHVAAGRYAEAVEAYEMALTSADDDAYVLARLAEAQDHAGETEAAARTLRTGLELDPQSE